MCLSFLRRFSSFVKDKWPVFQETVSTVGDVVFKVFETLCGVLVNVYGFLGDILNKVMDFLGIDSEESASVKMNNVSGEDQKKIADQHKELYNARAKEHAAGIQYVPYDNLCNPPSPGRTSSDSQ